MATRERRGWTTSGEATSANFTNDERGKAEGFGVRKVAGKGTRRRGGGEAWGGGSPFPSGVTRGACDSHGRGDVHEALCILYHVFTFDL